VVAAFASAQVDMALVQQVLLCTLIALLMAHLIEKHDVQLAAMSQPTSVPTRLPFQSPQDEPMDMDTALPCSPSLLLSSAPQALPFLGMLIDGTHKVVYYDL
jgi:hypothetical protein